MPETFDYPDLTPRQNAVLAAIVNYRLANDRMPTFREIMARVGVASPNGVMAHIKPLVRKGYLSRVELTARGLALTAKVTSCASVRRAGAGVSVQLACGLSVHLSREQIALAYQLLFAGKEDEGNG